MHSITTLSLVALPLAAAFPSLPLNTRVPPECNTGPICSTTFDAKDQFLNVGPGSGHEWAAPGKNDRRGQCPGLNAAANHGFLPRSGIVTIAQTITGLAQAYNMAVDLSGFLAVVSVALSGDFLTETWSIGGEYPVDLVGGLLSEPQGIAGTHNKYEGDASIGRQDAYLADGSVGKLRLDVFDRLYNSANAAGNINFRAMRAHNNYVAQYSVSKNPYYFSAPFSGLVTPAAHNFIMNFMSNHSAQTPGGYLSQSILKTFFAISGPDNAHVWTPGHERIPNNWYRRPTTNQYDIAKTLEDVAITRTIYPDVVRFGGNTGKVNTFTGVDIANLTGGTYNARTLFQGNNLGCFFIQAFQAGLPDELKGVVADVAPVLALVQKYSGPVLTKLRCKPLEQYNQGLFNVYPGSNYTGKPGSN